jgi:D-alanine-D-alanine ligase-like ATP-grasp enzyme
MASRATLACYALSMAFGICSLKPTFKERRNERGSVIEKRLRHARRHLSQLGVRHRNLTNLVIVAEALDRGISVGTASNPRYIEFSFKGRKRRWLDGFTDHNARLARRMTKQKNVTNALLRSFGVPAPQNAVFGPGEVTRAWCWGEPLGKLVVKPNDGNQGRDVFANVTTRREFEEAFTHVSGTNDSVLVEEFVPGTEHRCLLVDGRLIAATDRRPASVLGQGSATIRELIDEKNTRRKPGHLPLKLEDAALNQIGKLGLSLDSVVPDGQRVYLRSTSNLHTGGDAIDATDSITEGERKVIEKAARTLVGLRVAGVDVLRLRPQASVTPTATILEVNPSPMISMHHFPWEGRPRDAAGAILDSMFPKTQR